MIGVREELAGIAVLHRLWVSVSTVAAFWCLLLALRAWHRERTLRGRAGTLLAVRKQRQPDRGPKTVPDWVMRWAPPFCAFLACWALLGGPMGAAVGCAVAYALWRRGRAGVAGRDKDGEAEFVRGLPLAADLLAACVASGAGPREAAEAVGDALGGPVGERLARAAAELRLGGEPAEAWGRFGRIPGAGALARCLERAGATGAPAAEPVARLAEGLRAERARRATARAQRAQVLITGPVGLCFLPAFLAVGVAPVVLGMTAGLLHGG